MDMKTKIKSDLLQRLIEYMDEKSVDGLKAKSPKFMKVETNDPEMAQDVVKNAIEDKMEDPAKEMSPEDLKEDLSEGEDPMDEKDHTQPASDEDLRRLLEMYQKLK